MNKVLYRVVLALTIAVGGVVETTAQDSSTTEQAANPSASTISAVKRANAKTKAAKGAAADTVAQLQRIPSVKLGDWTTINYDTIQLRPSYAFLPMIFKQQMLSSDSIKTFSPQGQYSLNIDREWINEPIEQVNRSHDVMNYTVSHSPEVVIYNAQNLPEPPKEFVSVVDPKTRMLKIEERKFDNVAVDAKKEEIDIHNWLHTFSGSLQFSQSYISANWYQGGDNNLNIISDMQWDVQLNTNVHKKYLFSNSIRYRVGVITTPDDTERNYSFSDDYFLWTTQFGIKAIDKWYYSTTMQFTTQIFNNYVSNSQTRSTSFLSPAELNLGVGLTFSNSSKDGWRTINLQVSPLSYNMKYCKSDDNPAPSSFGIAEGHHFKHDVGSKLELKYTWKFSPSISWTTRLYAFTNYDYVQGDWENTFDFSVTSHLTTKLYVHLRYDKSATKDVDWKYWQMKEILSFGLAYKFATD